MDLRFKIMEYFFKQIMPCISAFGKIENQPLENEIAFLGIRLQSYAESILRATVQKYKDDFIRARLHFYHKYTLYFLLNIKQIFLYGIFNFRRNIRHKNLKIFN